MTDSDLIFGLMASFNKKEYSIGDLIHLIKPFNVTENSLRTNLSRMKANLILDSYKIDKTVYYKFNTRGKKMNAIANLSFSPPIWDGWNNDWYGVLFTVNEQKKEIRYQLRKRLIAYRFAPQYPGFWIRPAHQVENDKYKFEKTFDTNHSKLIQFNFTKIPDNKEIQSIWNLHNINKEYMKGIQQINNTSNTILNINPIDALKTKMYLGYEVVKLIFKNPFLPPRFLPADWKGDELRRKFFELDKKLTEISKPYWIKILTNQ